MSFFIIEVIKINKHITKKIIKHLFSERTNLHASSLSYLTILAIIPTLIITTSLFNILTNYLPLLKHPYFHKINAILVYLNLNTASSLIINIICINLLSSGIFSLLTTFEDLYKFKFKNYIRKKLYSISISIIIVLIIVLGLSIAFTISSANFLKSIDFIIDFFIIFISLISFYKIATFQKIKHTYIGSTIAAILLTIFLHFFYYIVNNFSTLSSYYGTLTPLMLSFILIYYSCYIIYLGILINYETKKLSRIKK